MIQTYPPPVAGTVTMLHDMPSTQEAAELTLHYPGAVFAAGSRDEIELVASRIRAGALEQERRQARRRQQRASRKRNR